MDTFGLLVLIFLAASLYWILHLRRKVTLQQEKLARSGRDLKATAERFRILLENSHDFLSEVDSEGNFQYVNPNFETLGGYKNHSLIRTPGLDLIHPEDRSMVIEAGKRLHQAGGIIPSLMCRVRFASQEYRWLDSTAIAVRDDHGESRILVMSRDVSDRRRLEEQLRETQKMDAIGHLAGGIAHDFNNILTAILGYANMLKHDLEPGSSAQDAAQTIEIAAKRAAELTSQLLGFARRGKTQNTALDTHVVVREVNRLLVRTFDRNIKVLQTLEASPSFTVGDPSQIQQVVLNLAVNARDAMPNGGTLHFETGTVIADANEELRQQGLPPGQYVSLKVSDTGSGIPPEIRTKIFEPFFTTKEPGKGTGMGLAMVYGIVKSHGGLILLDSEVGKGTTFTVLLPAVAAPKTQAANASVFGTIPRGTGKILVVDDDPMIRAFAGEVITKLGYKPVLAPGASEALEIFKTNPTDIDLVFLDVVMPGMDGVECFRKLKGIRPEVKVVFCSGQDLNERVQQALQEGALGFLPKPYKLREVGEILARIIPRSKGDGACENAGRAAQHPNPP